LVTILKDPELQVAMRLAPHVTLKPIFLRISIASTAEACVAPKLLLPKNINISQYPFPALPLADLRIEVRTPPAVGCLFDLRQPKAGCDPTIPQLALASAAAAFWTNRKSASPFSALYCKSPAKTSTFLPAKSEPHFPLQLTPVLGGAPQQKTAGTNQPNQSPPTLISRAA
jgi:hypothetical protein